MIPGAEALAGRLAIQAEALADSLQGEMRVALHMCLDALQGRPLPMAPPSPPSVASPPPPAITDQDIQALLTRFKVL